MASYFELMILCCLVLTGVDGTGSSCIDIDPLACAQMATQNANLCASDNLFATSACPKLCGNCPVTCYNCNTTRADASSCNTITCKKDEMCMVKAMTSSKTGYISYSFGCTAPMYCNVGSEKEIQSRSASIKCCNNDLCNTLTTSTSSSSTTSQTTKTTTQSPTRASSRTPTVSTARSPCSWNPCVYGGCSENGTGYVCKCYSGYIGRRCNYRDQCLHSPCKHGVCKTVFNGGRFKCTCNAGYTGTYCEKPPTTISSTTTTTTTTTISTTS